MSTAKKRRGRPAKVVQATEEKAIDKKKDIEEIPDPPKTVNQHVSKIRCTAVDLRYPAFMNRSCGHVMVALNTTKGGTHKRWKCPICETITTTVANQI